MRGASDAGKSFKVPTSLVGIALVMVGVVTGLGVGLSLLGEEQTGVSRIDDAVGSRPTTQREGSINVSTTDQRTVAASSADFHVAWRDAMAVPLNEQSLWKVAVRWIELDPADVMNTILAEGSLPAHWAMELVRRWAVEHPQEALNWLYSQPHSGVKSRLIGTALETVVVMDPSLALSYADQLEGAARQRAYDALLRRWAEQDPRSVAVWFETQAAVDLPRRSLFNVATRYSQLDPEEALRWAQRVGSPKMVGKVVQAAADRSLSTAEGLVRTVADSDGLAEAMGALVQAYVDSEPQAAENWLRNNAHPNETEQHGLYMGLFLSWAIRDLEEAVEHLDQLPVDGSRQAAALGTIRGATMLGEMSLAEELFATIPDDPRLDHLAAEFFEHFRGIDSARSDRYRKRAERADQQTAGAPDGT